MTLTLTILRCPDRVGPETRRLEGGELVLGRGPGADWVLRDPSAQPQISRRHCTIGFAGGAWTVTDTSTNGTMLNGQPAPQARPSRALRDGDRLGLGPYEIEIALVEQPYAPPGLAAGQPAFGGGAPAAGSFADPFAKPAFSTGGMGGAARVGEIGTPFTSDHGSINELSRPRAALPPGGLNDDPFAPPSVRLPDDFAAELLAAPPPRPAAQQDHSPAQADALLPPMARTMLPAGWDDELAGLARPAQPEATPAPGPVSSPLPQPGYPADAGAAPATPASGNAGPVAHTPPSVAGAADGQILEAFLIGAGMADARLENPVSAMREAGAAFRAFVRGLRGVLIARAEIKSAFRIDQTMVRARHNNPLKFAAGDDDALAALLGTGRRTDMTAREAVDGALADIRHHEVATMAAMQDAVRDLLGRLDPARFKSAAEGGLLPAQRRAHAFGLYEAEYRKIHESLGEKLDDAFGRAFAAAYERVTADLRSKEPPT